MNKKFLVAVTLYCVISVLGYASASITKDISLMPKAFRFQEEDYKVDEKFSEEYNVTIKQDFDGDGQQEVLIGFQGANG